MVSDAPLEQSGNTFVSRLHTNDEKIKPEHVRGALRFLLIRHGKIPTTREEAVLFETGALVILLALENRR